MILYMCHPVGASTVTHIRANLERAKLWLWYLRRLRPDDTIVAPWIVDVEVAIANSGDEATHRERGLRDCERVIARCDGMIVCGGTLSAGMTRECGAFLRATLGHGVFLDLLYMGAEPPEVV